MLDQLRATVSGLSAEYPLIEMGMVHHENTRGVALTFRDRPFLVELYTEMHEVPRAVFRKAVQTGISELLIQLALYHSGWEGRICAYVLPTYNIRNRFVQQRVNTLLQRVPAYRARTPGGDLAKDKAGAGNLALKRFGAGAMMFLSSKTATDFVEFSADTLIIDEYDKCAPDHLPLARDRLRASDKPQMIRLGNPTMPRVGVSKLYDASDQRRWFHRCDHCRAWQPIDWFLNLVQRDDEGKWIPRDLERFQGALHGGPDIRPVCRSCDRPYERGVEMGAWVAACPDVEERGYWLSRLDDLGETMIGLFAEWIAAQGDSLKIAAFFKSILGMPHEKSGARVTVEILDRSARAEDMDLAGGPYLKPLLVTAGIDVGALLNVEIAAIREGEDGDPVRENVFVGAFRTFEEVEDALERYHVDIAVIDERPEVRKAQELRDSVQAKGGCVVWLCRFHPTPRAGAQKYGMRLDYQAQIITVDRTAVFDVTFDDLTEGRCTYPSEAFSVLGWSEQMRTPVRVFDEKGNRFIWTKTDKADHYRLAGVYSRVAFDLHEMGGSYSALD